MKKHCVIVNPAAGKGAAKQAIPEIRSCLDSLNINYDLILTTRPGHAIQLAEEAGSNGYHSVVAVGGDGTANEVINGLMRSKIAGGGTAALGVLCVGRGNDFAYGVNIPVVAESVEERVRYAARHYGGVEVRHVKVHVAGVSRD